MILVGYILFLLLGLRFLVALVNWLSKPYLLKSTSLQFTPRVSILIPARNEGDNLPKILADLQKLDYPNFEVIVCNDHSTDHTEQVLQATEQLFHQLHYFNNQSLPKGWIGKNFACYQLANRASGEYFLFLDADVRIMPQLLLNAMAYMQKRQLKLLSLFPKQIIESDGEWKTIPLMNWILLTFLPLSLVRLKWFASLSAANGQMMLFETTSYRTYEWHKKVMATNVEDIAIARLMKKTRLPIAVLLGSNDIACSMYANYDEAIKGFALNMHQYFNGSRLWMLFFLAASWVRLPILLLSRQYVLFCLALIMVAVMKLMVSNLSYFNFKENSRYHFAQLLALSRIVALNFKNRFLRKIEWKGRVYPNK